MHSLLNWIRKRKYALSELLQWIVTLIEIAIIACVLLLIFGLFNGLVNAEEEGQRVWVLCQPDSYVSLREKPGKKQQSFGGVSCGGSMLTDGKTKNSYLHVYDLAAEETSGWISTHYIIFDEPTEINTKMVIHSHGRVACRKWVNGKIIRWLNNGDTLTVYWMSKEWSITNRGYIKTEFLEVIKDGAN